MELAIPCYWFDSQSVAPDLLTKTALRPEKSGSASRIRCRSCHEVVTDKQQAIKQNGSHVHHGTNPGGYEFDFACYEEAPGCSEVGPSSYAHSWFQAYSWQIAICAACGEHLGWRFSGETRFYGLILDKLLIDDQPSA
jgi:hypothetical protein